MTTSHGDLSDDDLSVICVGMFRIGTTSLKNALEILDISKGYHYEAMIDKHLDDHPDLWQRAGQGQQIDWNKIFSGYYNAFASPVLNFYRELIEFIFKSKIYFNLPS
ncbi:unnamed protein product [Didymodactylos carnosus]|uniref:Sulfotransferase n=2 Tax=Didymodactylos carnosus TaxID=1234261 RepID=A0A8S2UGS0_9BILA|nr:unnamed protein product [Didymodactylos carnosus]CAF4334714.1 unnamed protein product [Didymodactylos carnosus]